MRRTLQLALVFLAVAAVSVAAAPQDDAALVAQGRMVFQAKCTVCHGVNGDGRGPAAYLLSPRPRDLTTGVFKLKSTEVGSLPTDQDIFRTLTAGIPGTSMPSWATLSEASRWALVAYVKSLSDRFQDEEPEGAVQIPPEPRGDAASVERGRQVYEQMKCFECHGSRGQGDGPSANTLRDNWGYPIRAFNFTAGTKMRGGGAAPDIYRTMTMGLEGTPMPAYGPMLAPEQAWDLVHFIQSLGVRPADFPAAANAVVQVQRTTDEISMDPNDPQWQRAPVVGLPVRPLWTRDAAPDYVIVRGLTNGRDIGIYVEWTDPIPDEQVLNQESFRDAVAVQFPLEPVTSGEDAPFYGMGDAQDTVNIWQWKADWQADLVAFGDVRSEYPTLATDGYPRDSAERRQYTSGWQAGNLLSTPHRGTAVEDVNAQGQGTLTSQPAKDQNVDGRGVWADGTWRVVFRRAVRGQGKLDVTFPRTGWDGLRMAVAVWNGAEGDRNGQKLVSEWHRLQLQAEGNAPRVQSAAATK